MFRFAPRAKFADAESLILAANVGALTCGQYVDLDGAKGRFVGMVGEVVHIVWGAKASSNATFRTALEAYRVALADYDRAIKARLATRHAKRVVTAESNVSQIVSCVVGIAMVIALIAFGWNVAAIVVAVVAWIALSVASGPDHENMAETKGYSLHNNRRV